MFWQRYKEIEDWERQMKKIEDAEARRDKDRYIERLLKDKVESTRHPFQSLTVAYASKCKMVGLSRISRSLLCRSNQGKDLH